MKQLSSEERATVVAAVLSGIDDAGQILSRLAAPSAQRCAEAVARLGKLERDKRVRAVVDEVRRLTGTPGQLNRMHETWIEHCLAGAGELGKMALSGDGEASPQTLWLQHAFFGRLVPMSCHDDVKFEALLVRDPDAIVAALTTLGRGRLAQAVRAAPKDAAAALAAKLGPEHGSRFLAEVGESTVDEETSRAVKELADLMGELSPTGDDGRGDAKRRALGGTRRALPEGGGDAKRRPFSVAELLFRAGARFVGAALLVRAGDCNRQLAQRMPMARGKLFLHEVKGLAAAEARLDEAEAEARLTALLGCCA